MGSRKGAEVARGGAYFLVVQRGEVRADVVGMQRGVTGEPSGLYKSRGAAVEAVVGAVYVRHVSSRPGCCERREG